MRRNGCFFMNGAVFSEPIQRSKRLSASIDCKQGQEEQCGSARFVHAVIVPPSWRRVLLNGCCMDVLRHILTPVILLATIGVQSVRDNLMVKRQSVFRMADERHRHY